MAMATAKVQAKLRANCPLLFKVARALVAPGDNRAGLDVMGNYMANTASSDAVIIFPVPLPGFPPPPPGTPNPESQCEALPGRCNENECNGKEGWCQAGPHAGCPCTECPEKKDLCGDTGCFGEEGKCSEGVHEGCECDENRRLIPTGTQAIMPVRPTNPVAPPPVCPSRPGQCDSCGGDSIQEGVCNGPDLLHCNCCKGTLIPCSDCGGNNGQGRCKSYDSQGRYKDCACKGNSVPASKPAPIGLFPRLDPAQHVIAMECGVPPHPDNVEIPPLSVKMSDCDKMRKEFTTGDVLGTIDSQSDCVGPTKQTAGPDGKVISTACAIRVEGSCALVIGSQNSINDGHTKVVRNNLGNFISDAAHRKVGSCAAEDVAFSVGFEGADGDFGGVSYCLLPPDLIEYCGCDRENIK